MNQQDNQRESKIRKYNDMKIQQTLIRQNNNNSKIEQASRKQYTQISPKGFQQSYSISINQSNSEQNSYQQNSKNQISLLDSKKIAYLSLQKQLNAKIKNNIQKNSLSILQRKYNNMQNYINQISKQQKISKLAQIVINLTNTKYSVVQNASKQLGFKVSYENDDSNGVSHWDIKWTDIGLGVDCVKKLNQNQRINFFIGINSIARKNLLMINLYNMKDLFFDQYDYFPQTFQYPNEFSKIQKFMKDKKKSHQKVTFIVKPQASCQGRGIYLTQNLQQIDDSSKSIVQHYISQPMLYEGLKFDFRIYVLLKSVNPLEIYIYKQGLVRFATQRYEQPNKYNMDDLCIHLTNYAINKSNPKYQFNQSLKNLNYGHKKSLADFMKALKSKGYNSVQIWKQIKIKVIKTIIAVQPHLNYEYRKAQPKHQDRSVCFQVLGFDFMLNDRNKVFLLEVNQSPSFSTDSPLDLLVKNYLIKDTLNIIKEERAKNKKRRQTALRKIKTQNQNSDKLNNDTQLRKNNKQNIGNYELIYPSKDQNIQNLYEKLIRFSTKLFHNSVTLSGSIMKSIQKQVQKAKGSITPLRQKQLVQGSYSNLISPKLPKIYTSQRLQIVKNLNIDHILPFKSIVSQEKNKIASRNISIHLRKKQYQQNIEISNKFSNEAALTNRKIVEDSLLYEKNISQKSILLKQNRKNLFAEVINKNKTSKHQQSKNYDFSQRIKILNVIRQMQKSQPQIKKDMQAIQKQYQHKRQKTVISKKQQKVVQQTPLQRFMKYLNPLNRVSIHRQFKQKQRNSSGQ